MTRFVVSLLVLTLAACSERASDQPLHPEQVQPSEAPAMAPASQAAVKLVSQYTSLKDCKIEELREDEDWSVSRCAGPAGYSLIVEYGDARDDLRLVRPGGKPIALGLLQLSGGGFNSLGDAVEWRGTGTAAQFVPTALIVRNNAVESPERPDQPTGFLVVIDLVQGCAVAQVRPVAWQNAAARTIADGPKQPCLKGRP